MNNLILEVHKKYNNGQLDYDFKMNTEKYEEIQHLIASLIIWAQQLDEDLNLFGDLIEKN